MKFYVSGRTGKVDSVREIYDFLEEQGHTVSFDWTSVNKSLSRPYNSNPDLVGIHAKKIIDSIRDSDIFVMLADEGGIDMYAELSSALSFNNENGKPLVYVIGENNSPSIFTFHSEVRFKNSIEGILEDLE